uniref:Glutaredoxin-1 n=1 Tax=Oncorhynchus tshawytscha TaxID=74940 RepID=A0AAZ3SD05_ONCTS
MAQEFVETKLRGDKVTIFLKPSCPYCVTAKEVLTKYKFKAGHLEFIDITGRSDMSSLQDYFLEITGARTGVAAGGCHMTRQRDFLSLRRRCWYSLSS